MTVSKINKGGRPKSIIDYAQLKELCSIYCTGVECAAVLGIDYSTLNEHLKADGYTGFPEYFKKHSCEGNVSLRRKQFETAMEGSVPMMIWLGKQFLGQSDKTYAEVVDKTPPQKKMTTEELQAELKTMGVKVVEI